jgi:DNA-binding transcriptional MerR regulator
MRYIDGETYYTPKEIYSKLGITIHNLLYARKKGLLPFSHIEIMGRYLYPKEQVDKYFSHLKDCHKIKNDSPFDFDTYKKKSEKIHKKKSEKKNIDL